jgi:hypothetical protein
MEDAMNKLFALTTALIAAVTMFASGAEAGFKIRLGFGGPLPAFTAYGNSGGSYERNYAPKRRYQAARHHEKAPARVSKKAKIAKAVEAEPQAKVVAKAAETENSSIAGAETQVSEVTTPAPVETARATVNEAEPSAKLDCKKFFPSVGMTLTVPCE